MGENKPANVKPTPQAAVQPAKPAQPAKLVQPMVTPPPKIPALTNILPKKVKQRLADLQELSIAIDSFDDIFSDFDPREYSKRDLSEDFLREMRHRYKESQRGALEVSFYTPTSLHNDTLEKMTIQRIKQHYRHIANQTKKAISVIRNRGFFYIGFGLVLLFALTYTTYLKIFSDLHIQIFGILFMPLGWFGIWEGFSKVLDLPWKLKEELEFSTKLAKANYLFKFLG